MISRSFRPVLALMLLALAIRSAAVPAAQAGGPAPVTEVAAIGITVGDMPRALAFYRDVLGFERVDEREAAHDEAERLHGIAGGRLRIVRLRLGDETIELTEWRTPRGRPIPHDSRSHDAWFQHIAIIVSDMDAAYRHLQQRGVAGISPAPQRLPEWNPAAGGIQAYYFRDPDGHPLELLQFPPGKGDPRWHVKARLFLGIDHTAIVVRDTTASLRLYRDRLGLRVVGRSENHGPEQERLNDVPGASLLITTLRAARGPAIELLEYRHPRDGRRAPADGRANDLAHWQTILLGDIARIVATLPALPRLSRGVIDAEHRGQAVVVRDPDGHALQLRTPDF